MIASIDLIFPGVRLGKNAVVASGSVVKKDIPEWKLAMGDPAKPVCDIRILRMPDNPKIRAYPWRDRFHRGYPQQIVDAWESSKNKG